MPGGAESLDGGVESDHGVSHVIAGRIGVEAAVEAESLGEQRGKPGGVGSGAGGGEAEAVGIEDRATEGVDGRFAQDSHLGVRGTGCEVAQVFTGARGEAAPSGSCSAAEFGANGPVFLSKEQEDGIGLVVGIKAAGLNERLQEPVR